MRVASCVLFMIQELWRFSGFGTRSLVFGAVHGPVMEQALWANA